ncbi:methylated-DNA--[protein]-cysteine S-methyltransferase [Desertihabitans brevis]|uniref:Methylated-DNA--protein-cysteine methyltransferase n=1 Tax=Desertihabitans brevis TaxID=2268447 RepID=A0A367YUH0_9ACTN|nr:methylated-DNA--[protein]-cysteine S-methyltransferase [Desertihabitans brevis]RCK69468.1 methylated-DNA--[protein]-cysteine S-methyltransferase [Desertihabitans brevis]
MPTTHSVLDSPVGPLTLIATDGVLSAVLMSAHRHPRLDRGVRDDAALAPARDQLAEYFAGERTVFDLPLAPQGSPFERRVWAELQQIPYGRTRSYGELARALGRPRAAQAVGAANGRNPVAIVIPCHRVVGADGALTGYAGGLERKRQLLELENPTLLSPPALF